MEALRIVDTRESQRHLRGCESTHEALASWKVTVRLEGELKAHENGGLAERWAISRCL